MRSITRTIRRLKRSQSGNAMLIAALSMPVMVGGAGMATDMTQWYMWKSELQYATDQAALAGAYARTDVTTEQSYVQRAEQEFAANLSQTSDFAEDPQTRIANWATGSNNSVVVTAGATRKLPFSSFLTGKAVTVRVKSQASFEKGRNFTSCLIAVDEDATGAVTIGGNAKFIAGCGIAALSDADEAISVDGNPTIDAGWLVTKGGVDDWFKDPNNSTDQILERQEGLFDPFGCEGEGACITPPDNPTKRVYTCPKGKTTTTFIADQVVTRTQITYTYWKKTGNSYNTYNYAGSYKHANVDNTVTQTNVTIDHLPTVNPEVTGPSDSDYVWIDGSGGNKVYEKANTKVTKTYTNARASTEAEQGGAAILEPGTYTDLGIKCDTVFKSGIYVLDGGMLDINAQNNVTGAGIMIVLKNGAGISINGGANINLTAMSVSQLEAAGVAHVDAVKLAGMLIFEDRASQGNTKNKINGNASTVLNGAVYLSKSNLELLGTASVTSQCLMLVASTITLSGNMAMESFCPANLEETHTVLSTKDRVKLVS